MLNKKVRFFRNIKFHCLAISFLIIFFLPVFIANAQNEAEAGLPFVTNYYAKDYEASAQNWAIIEDNRGVMYFGNNNGLLEYDGVKWRTIASGVNSIVRSLAKDKNGQIYYGGYGNFGYLAPDSLGQNRLHSLVKFLPAAYRNFNDVWTVYTTEDGIYFQSRERIFRLRKIDRGSSENWDVKVWNSPKANKFMYSFYLDSTYYVHQQGVGLLKMVNDSLVIIPGSEFMGDERVQVMLPYTPPNGIAQQKQQKQYLLGAFYSGLYLYNGTTFTHFATDADSLIKNNTLYKGILLKDGSYVLATAGRGAFIVNNQGKKLQQLNREIGLQDESVYAVYTDRKGTLWMALDNGISRVESASPFTQFTVQSGISTATIAVHRFEGVLYVGTTNGLLRFNSSAQKFEQVKSIPTNQVFCLTPDGDKMLISTDGLFYTKDNQTGMVEKSVAGNLLISALMVYKKNPDILFAGLAGGTAIFYKPGNGLPKKQKTTSPSGWVFAGNIPGIFEDVWSFAEESNGTVWAGTQQGVLRLSNFMDGAGNPTPAKTYLERFGSANGLSDGSVHVSSVNGKVFFVSNKSVYRFDETNKRFITDNTFGEMGFGNDPNQYVMTADEKGRVWLNFGKETALASPQPGGGYRIEKTPFLPLSDHVVAGIFPEANGIIWFATTDGLIKYNENLKKDYDETFKTFLRNVIAGNQALNASRSGNQLISLNYKQNTLRFEYAAPFFEHEEKTKYQTWLEGFEQGWSGWDNNTYKEYTNLPHGNYKFHVRAMNVYQKTSEEAVYNFTISPPWFQTWWAYLLYALAAISIVYLVVRYRTKQLHEKHRELEKTVSERTHELSQRVEELAVINSVQGALVSALDMQAIYDLVGDRLQEVFDAQAVIIATFDHKAGTENFRYTIENGKRFYPEARSLDKLRNDLIKTRQKIVIKTAKEAFAWFGMTALPGTKPLKSGVFVPLTIGDKITSYVSLQNVDRENAFSDGDIRLLETLANSMSVALENARLFDQTQRLLQETEQRNAELAVINSVQEALVSAMDMQAIYNLVGERIQAVFDAQVVLIATLDDENKIEHFQYHFEKGARSIPDPRPLDKLRQHLIETRQKILINKSTDEIRTRYGLKLVPGTEVPKSLLFVPLVVGDKVTSYVSLQNIDRENAFSDADVRLLETLSNGMSVALENARLFDETNRLLKETEQRTAELAVINSVQDGLAKELDMQGIYDLVGGRLQELFNAQVVIIASFDLANKTEYFNYAFENGYRFNIAPRPISDMRQMLIDKKHTIYIQTEQAARAEFGITAIADTKMPKSLLFVPLLTGNIIKGYVSLQNVDTENAFSESDVGLLETLANSMSVALENARLFDETSRLLRETEQRTAELAVINSVQQGLAKELNMQSIYDLVGNKIREVFDAQAVGIATLDQETKTETFNYMIEKGERYYPQPRPYDKLREQLIRTKEKILVNNNIGNAFAEFGLKVIEGSGMPKSLLYVPLIANNKVSSYVTLQNIDKENAFSDSDVRLLETLANSMSVALESARLFDETNRLLKETEQRTAELRIINSVQEGLASKLDVQAIYDLVGDKIRNVFDTQGVGISYYDREKNFIAHPYYFFRGQRISEPGFELGKGLTSLIIKTGHPLLINENAAEKFKELGAVFASSEDEGTTKSWLGVPLISGGQVNGTIRLENYEREFAYSESDLSLLQTLANSMSVALENARLFDETNRLLKETEQRTAELAVINSVQDGLAKELDMQGIYDLVGERIRTLFDAQVVVIRTFDAGSESEHLRYAIEKNKRIYSEPRQIMWANKELIQSKEPLLISENYVETAMRFGSTGVTKGQAPKAAVFVPMVVGGLVKGSVSLQNVDREHAFTESDVRLLTTLTNSMSVALENARLFDETNRLLKETEQRTAELAVINSVQDGLVREMDMQGIYDLVGDRLQHLFSAQAVIIASFDLANKTEYFNYVFENGQRFNLTPRPIGDMRQQLIEKRHTIYIETEKAASTEFGITAIGDTKMPKSLLFVPLLSGNEVKGYVSLQNIDIEHAFSTADIRLLETLANSMTVALQNARLFDETTLLLRETKQRATELSTVNNISKALATQLDPNELINVVGDQLKVLFNANIIYLALLNQKTNIISFPYQYGENNPPMRLGEGLTSKIILTKEPLLINKDVQELTAQLGVKRVGIPASSYLGVPIPVGDEIIGVLSIQSTEQENRFDENDLRLLSTIAASVGVALRNATLFEEVQHAKMEADAARKTAEKANEAKSAFLSTVSHELRTPLTSVLGFAKIIRKRLEEKIFPLTNTSDPRTEKTIQQVSENLDVVVSEGERLTTLINDVLDLAKIEAGKMEWNFENVNMSEVAERAIAATTSLFDQKNLVLKKNIKAELPEISGDRDKLIQVMVNLISNAVKFTPSGTVTCNVQKKNKEIIVGITDTGIGIAPEDHTAVFEQFKQVGGDTLTDKPKGTGLGLPICKEIVEHHGGRIWLESEQGKGSTFFFALPVTKTDTAKPMLLDDLVRQLKQRMAQSKLKTNGKGTTILVVDDEDSIRSLLRQELGEAGYHIEEASNGKEALAKVRVNRPDLIILDVMMPEMNGFDVAAILKNDPQTMDIPIIVLSIVQDKARGYRIGVDRYLTKPIDTTSLFAEVGVLLEQGKSKKKVLVVDEDSGAVKALSDVLKAKGYSVVESDGKELVAKAVSTQPDIIILNSVFSGKQEIVQSLRFEKGLENVLFLIYQ